MMTHLASAPITPEILALAQGSVLAWLATVDEHGQPHVSPKEIFSLPDGHHALVAHIASPGSVRRIRTHALVALSFVNVFLQKGVQLLGTARVLEQGDADFDRWTKDLMVLAGPRFPLAAVILIRVSQVRPIVAPSYSLYPEHTTEASQVQSALQTYRRVARTGGQGDKTLQPDSPESVVARQLEAYNRRDVDAWLATYHPEAIQRDGHGTVLASGHAAIRARTAPRMQDPNLHAHLHERCVMGAVVIDHETVTRQFPEGLCTIDRVCVYEVREGLIQSATFWMEAPVPVV